MMVAAKLLIRNWIKTTAKNSERGEFHKKVVESSLACPTIDVLDRIFINIA
jgi:hypothetical protein